LLTDLEAAQAVIARLLRERFWKEAGAVSRSIESDANVECPSRPKPALLVYDLDLLIEHLTGEPIDRYMHPVMLFHFRDKIRQG